MVELVHYTLVSVTSPGGALVGAGMGAGILPVFVVSPAAVGPPGAHLPLRPAHGTVR